MTSRVSVSVFAAASAATALLLLIVLRTDRPQSLFRALSAYGYRTHRLDNALKLYSAFRVAKGAQPLCVDASFHQGCINVLVLDHNRLLSSFGTSETTHALAKPFLNNALAYPPDLIVIDEILPQLSIMGTFSALASAGTRISAGDPGMVATVSGLNIASIDNYQAFPLLGQLDTLARARFEVIADSAAAILFSDSLTADGAGAGVHAGVYSIAILLEHEIAHLERHSTGFYNGPAGLPVLKWLSQRTAREEAIADKLAVLRVGLYHYSDQQRGDEGIFTLLSPDGFGFLAYANMIEDWALYDGLDGFKGISAVDWGLNIRRPDCREHQRTRSNDFWVEPWVDNVGRKVLPLLSHSDFDSLSSRLGHSRNFQTHRHNLVRADEIRSTLGFPLMGRSALDGRSSYARALVDRRPELAYAEPFYDTVPNPTTLDSLLSAIQSTVRPASRDTGTPIRYLPGVPMRRVLQGLGKLFSLSPAVTCPTTRCYVGVPRTGSAYVEIAGSQDSVSWIRLKMDAHRPRARQEFFSDSIYLQGFMTTVAVLALSSRTGHDMNEAILQTGYLRDPLFQCGEGWRRIRQDGRDILATSLTARDWLEIEIRPPELYDNAGIDDSAWRRWRAKALH